MPAMITVTPFPSEKLPAPMPAMLGTGWITMIENADFVPDAAPFVAAPQSAESATKPVQLHQAAAPGPIAALPSVSRTKITMHNGEGLFYAHSFAEIAAMMG